MIIKPAKELVAEANEVVKVLKAEDATAMHGQALFVDVREPAEWEKGHVAGALHVPRGLLEFAADPSLPNHKPEFDASDRSFFTVRRAAGRHWRRAPLKRWATMTWPTSRAALKLGAMLAGRSKPEPLGAPEPLGHALTACGAWSPCGLMPPTRPAGCPTGAAAQRQDEIA